MPANVRKQIRRQVAVAVESVFPLGAVYPTRVVDARDAVAYANVFFSDGGAGYDGLALITQADLAVGVHLPWKTNTDDDLDNYADLIIELFKSDPRITLDNVVAGIIYTGFEYGDEDESPYIRLFVKFSVQY